MNYVVAWCVISAIGLLLSLYLAGQSSADLFAFRGLHNSRRVHAIGRLTSEVIRAVIYSGFLLIGVAALLKIQLGELSIQVLLVGTGLLIVNSLISIYVRIKTEVIHESAISPEELVMRAEYAAQQLLAQARTTAKTLVKAAEITAAELSDARHDSSLAALERTAEATERTADNTDPKTPRRS